MPHGQVTFGVVHSKKCIISRAWYVEDETLPSTSAIFNFSWTIRNLFLAARTEGKFDSLTCKPQNLQAPLTKSIPSPQVSMSAYSCKAEGEYIGNYKSKNYFTL